MSPDDLGRLAVLIFEGSTAATSAEVFNAEKLVDAMGTAHLHAKMAHENADRSDWGYLLGAFAVYTLIRQRNHILTTADVSLGDERLAELGLNYLEGCALLIATMVAESLLPGQPGLDISSHPRAIDEFRTKLALLQNETYPMGAAVEALSGILRQFAEPELRDPLEDRSKPWLTRQINARPLMLRLLVTMIIAPLIGGLIGFALRGHLERRELPTAHPAWPEVYLRDHSGPVKSNVVSRILVYPANAEAAQSYQSFLGELPQQAFVTGLNERFRVQVRLQRREGETAQPNISLAFGADSGLAVTPGTTTLVNTIHPTGTPVQDLGVKLTPVSLDPEGEVVYEFVLASSPDTNVFTCGYNLRAIRAFTADGEKMAVTPFPIYVFKPCK